MSREIHEGDIVKYHVNGKNCIVEHVVGREVHLAEVDNPKNKHVTNENSVTFIK